MEDNLPIKLIAVDIDDTLLNPDNVISRRNAEVIRQAQEQGITVTIATGRMYCSARPFAQQLGIDVPLITYNGALIKNSLSGDVLHFQPIKPDIAAAVLELFQRQGWYIQTYIDDVLYVKEVSSKARQYEALAKVEAIALGDEVYARHKGLLKMLAIAEREQLAVIQEAVRQEIGNELNIANSKVNYIELTHPLANKGIALDFLAKKLGIRQEQVMAIGDSTNDLDMLRYAGCSVAMGNAQDKVKKAARYVTLSNREDGVASAIEKYALQSGKNTRE